MPQRIVTGVLTSVLVGCSTESDRVPARDTAAAPPGSFSVTERGLGPLRVGMTLAEAGGHSTAPSSYRRGPTRRGAPT